MQHTPPQVRGLAPSILSLSLLVMAISLSGSPASASASAGAEGFDLAGRPIDPLHADPGRAVVLVFVRTDCPISNRYAPTIQRLSAEYADKASFWLVYPDRTESTSAIQKHLEEYRYKLRALRDPQHSLVKLGRVQVTPEVAVFGAGGTLVYHGRIDNWYQDFGHARTTPTTHELNDAIQAVVSGKMPQVASATSVGCYISDLE